MSVNNDSFVYCMFLSWYVESPNGNDINAEDALDTIMLYDIEECFDERFNNTIVDLFFEYDAYSLSSSVSLLSVASNVILSDYQNLSESAVNLTRLDHDIQADWHTIYPSSSISLSHSYSSPVTPANASSIDINRACDFNFYIPPLSTNLTIAANATSLLPTETAAGDGDDDDASVSFSRLSQIALIPALSCVASCILLVFVVCFLRIRSRRATQLKLRQATSGSKVQTVDMTIVGGGGNENEKNNKNNNGQHEHAHKLEHKHKHIVAQAKLQSIPTSSSKASNATNQTSTAVQLQGQKRQKQKQKHKRIHARHYSEHVVAGNDAAHAAEATHKSRSYSSPPNMMKVPVSLMVPQSIQLSDQMSEIVNSSPDLPQSPVKQPMRHPKHLKTLSKHSRHSSRHSRHSSRHSRQSSRSSKKQQQQQHSNGRNKRDHDVQQQQQQEQKYESEPDDDLDDDNQSQYEDAELQPGSSHHSSNHGHIRQQNSRESRPQSLRSVINLNNNGDDEKNEVVVPLHVNNLSGKTHSAMAPTTRNNSQRTDIIAAANTFGTEVDVDVDFFAIERKSNAHLSSPALREDQSLSGDSDVMYHNYGQQETLGGNGNGNGNDHATMTNAHLQGTAQMGEISPKTSADIYGADDGGVDGVPNALALDDTMSINSDALKVAYHHEVKRWFDTKLKSLLTARHSYCRMFIEHGFENMAVIKTMTDVDLFDIGITKRGHRKQILLAIQSLQ
eukprot:CAMPEP_0202691018 /NCGR_PEP_ID=MMETSP1385-20130828/5852_1 /ASSEMBLY_ACC=CAM_ASM_000861 /TAXON_ID=933848 /ORGANISM="Elphidium margaritaceum" /LENGTH=730 /DNA_ID=CAMNT_0049346359 /DNA_START=1 /DNA_END=2193 /DNA_ORIENTATION=-